MHFLPKLKTCRRLNGWMVLRNNPIAKSFYCTNYESSITYYFKSNENKSTGNSVVFRTKGDLKCQYELVWKYHFSGNTNALLQCFCFHYWKYLMNFLHNNWRFIIDICSRKSCPKKLLKKFSSKNSKNRRPKRFSKKVIKQSSN